MARYYEVLGANSPTEMMNYVDYAFGQKEVVFNHYSAIFSGCIRLTHIEAQTIDGKTVEEYSEHAKFLTYSDTKRSLVLIVPKNPTESSRLATQRSATRVSVKNFCDGTHDHIVKSNELAALRLRIKELEGELQRSMQQVKYTMNTIGKRDAISPLCSTCGKPVSDYWDHYEEGGSGYGRWTCK